MSEFPTRETAIHVMNQARYFLPHIYALSVNSPFWVGRNTGLKGYRLKVFERFPRTGIPDAFESLSEYEDYCKLLVKTGCIDNAKKIWWDIRLHPFFDTLEFRVCDAQSRVDDTLAMAALIQAIMAKLHKLAAAKHHLPGLSPALARRESLARLPLWDRWKTDRFWPRSGSGNAQPDPGTSANSSRRKSTNSGANGSWRTRENPARRHRRGSPARGLGADPRHEGGGRPDCVEETYEGSEPAREPATP